MSTQFFTSEQLGPHREKTPEGYLLCRDVPISRVGTFCYEGSDVGEQLPWVWVTRSPEELFRPETIASFEGKPVVVGHEYFADPSNWRQIAVGHAQNVRQGEGKERGLLLADLLITDQKGIDLIEGGLREISCGYDSGYVNDGNGFGHQTDIVGNHIALVQRGRCGALCSIGDSLMEKKSIKTLFRRVFKDGNEEEFNELLDRTAISEAKDEEAPAETPAPEEKPAEKSTEERFVALEAAVSKLSDMVSELLAEKAERPSAEEEGEEPKPEEKPEEKADEGEPEAADPEEVKEVLGDAEELDPGVKKPACDAKDGGFTKDALARLKRTALKDADVKEFGDVETLDGKALDIAFKAAVEMARAKKNPVIKTADAMPASHRLSNAELNERFAAFWK